MASRTGKRCSDKGFLQMPEQAYLELLDWTARQTVAGKRGTTCDDLAWNFFGTRTYDKFHRLVEQKTGQAVEICSKDELEGLRQRKFRDLGAFASSWFDRFAMSLA